MGVTLYEDNRTFDVRKNSLIKTTQYEKDIPPNFQNKIIRAACNSLAVLFMGKPLYV